MLTALLIAHLLPHGGVSPVEALVHSAGWGFQHIIPNGLDHIAFVLGLFFLARRMQFLVAQVAVFTVAHSAASALAMLGRIAVPEIWVEIAVALSIAFVAVENLWGENLRRWRMAMVGVFGLIHGLAYAHSFAEMPVGGTVRTIALTGFNLGVGLGQMAVIGLAFLLAAPVWSKGWYRSHVAIPASCAIGLCGLLWAVERSLAL